jgi:hypothetical protein
MSVIETETEKVATHSLLETWGLNEPMRHVPPLSWIISKLDVDLRRRMETLYAPYRALPSDDPHRSGIESELQALCRSLDRLAEAARHARNNGHPPQDLASRIPWSLQHAVTSLGTLDPTLFGRRFPVQTHERSKAEPVYGALLVVIQHVDRLLRQVRTIDPGIDEKLLEGLVVLEHPLGEQTRLPIA